MTAGSGGHHSAPVLLVGLAGHDTVRARRGRGGFSAVRLLPFGRVYLAVEVAGMCAMFLFWLISGFGRRQERCVSLTYRLSAWWAAATEGPPAVPHA